jgi:hypothetical protein
VNQHATVEEAVFSVGAVPRLYNEDLTKLRDVELRESLRSEFDDDLRRNLKKGIGLCKEHFMCAAVTLLLV